MQLSTSAVSCHFSRQVLCLYYVAFWCVASNLLWSKNQISRLVRAACTQEETQRRNMEQGFSNRPPRAECQFTAQSPRPPESESLGEALESATSHRRPENHRWGTNTATTSALKPSWLIPIPLVEGEGVILSHFFSIRFFCISHSVWFPTPDSFLHSGGRLVLPRCPRAWVQPSTTTKPRNISRVAQLQAQPCSR